MHDALVSTIFLQPAQKQLCVAQLKCGLSSECWKAPKQAVAKPCGASSSKYEPSQKYKVGWSAVESGGEPLLECCLHKECHLQIIPNKTIHR